MVASLAERRHRPGYMCGGGARKGRGRGGEGEMVREWNGEEMRHGKWMKE